MLLLQGAWVQSLWGQQDPAYHIVQPPKKKERERERKKPSVPVTLLDLKKKKKKQKKLELVTPHYGPQFSYLYNGQV